jgi:hypothetical protein
MGKCDCDPACLSDETVPSPEYLQITKRAQEIIAEKDVELAALKNENENLKNRLRELGAGFLIQGDHKSAERALSAT